MILPRQQGIGGRGAGLFITSIVMTTLAAVFVGARLTYRLYTRRAGWDDWTIVMSSAISIVLTITMCEAIVNGYGQHKADLTKQQLRLAMEWYYYAQIVYKLIIGLTKISILASYLRIFTTSRLFRAACWSTIATVLMWTIGSTVATILQCIPIQAAWNKAVKGAKCTNSDVFWLAYGGINIATDLMILILPIRPVLQLKMRLREKVGLLLAFMVGTFVILTSILRVVAVKASVQNKEDATYNFVPRGTWTLVEANIGIVCACLPALRKPLLSLVSSQKMFTTANDSQEQSLAASKAMDSAIPLSANHSFREARSKPIMLTREYQVEEFVGTSSRAGARPSSSANRSYEM
ncbi:hypothetical protein K461DRAFT_281029 [Myriangium duriaei CBS 260.36]|uniref:Rhodopsin domain-containing protein n=1 Tax=Myriangium duriaei CBS 260.36 TaxID=1168546 RepID=A0A9P4ITP3_9PEZI|nr:hypothetical protein K461DRAFT_281029 [Myriangium duriaei CBS 260.36]